MTEFSSCLSSSSLFFWSAHSAHGDAFMECLFCNQLTIAWRAHHKYKGSLSKEHYHSVYNTLWQTPQFFFAAAVDSTFFVTFCADYTQQQIIVHTCTMWAWQRILICMEWILGKTNFFCFVFFVNNLALLWFNFWWLSVI